MSDQKVIVHAGAGDGEEYFKRKWLKDRDVEINLFEPIPELAWELTGKFMDWRNVRVINGALADNDKVVDFWVSENILGSSLFKEKKNLKNPWKIKVNNYDAGRVLKEKTEQGRVALNLNCEGSEFLILPRVTEENLWGKIDAIRIEWHHQAHRLPQFESEYSDQIRLLSSMNKQNLNQNEWFEFVKGWT